MTHFHWVRVDVRGASAAVMVAALTLPAGSQSALDRPPNLSAGWVGTAGMIHFNLMHRFMRSPAPARKVSNTPTMLVAGVLPRDVLVGLNYGTNSDLVAGIPNEWEFFARAAPLRQERGAPFDAAVHVGYNHAAESIDGELTLVRSAGPARVVVLGRAFSNGFAQDRTRVAVGGGAVLRMGKSAALAGDVVVPLERESGERAAWSAGLQLSIPYTPHSLSLHASNVGTATLQGSTRGGRKTLFGFEFTIPLTLRRYLPAQQAGGAAIWRGGAEGRTPGAPGAGHNAHDGWPDAGGSHESPPETARAPEDESFDYGSSVTVNASIRSMSYSPSRLQVVAGTTITWTNADPLPHTITARDSTWDSGTILPGAVWSRTFDKPGRYEFFCGPHPFMKGVIVVTVPRPTEQR